MSIRDDLKKTLVEAAKAKDQVLLDTLRGIQSAVKYKEIEKRSEFSDAEIISVIQTLCKQRKDSIDQYQKGGRQDLVEKETRELQILEKFLPVQLSAEEVEKVVKQVVAELGAKGPSDMGKVMKEVLRKVAGQADGKMVSEMVKVLINS